jgi:hypothetical protein
MPGGKASMSHAVVAAGIAAGIAAFPACISSSGPASGWTYEVDGTIDVSTAGSDQGAAATLLITVSPFDLDSPDDGIPQTIGWSDSCTVAVAVQDQDVMLPDACGEVFDVAVSRAGPITSPTLPACALAAIGAGADLPIQSGSATFSLDSRAVQLTVQAGGSGQPAVTYTFNSDAAIPPPPAPFTLPCPCSSD